ncbi:MAG: DUF4252 domain-containing protein [Thermoanaerobaculia bacterium]
MRRRAAVLIVAGLPWLVACDGEPPSASQVRAHLERSLPGVRFHQEEHIRLGRFSLALVRGLVRMAGEDRQTRQTLGSIRRVEVATYEVEGSLDLAGIAAPRDLERRLAETGWQPMVRERDEDSLTWVFVRPDEDGSIRNLYVVALDPAELTVVDLVGRIDEILARAVADDPDAFIGELG